MMTKKLKNAKKEDLIEVAKNEGIKLTTQILNMRMLCPMKNWSLLSAGAAALSQLT